MLEKDFKIFFLNLEDLVIDIFRATQQTPQMFSSKLAGAVTCVMLKKNYFKFDIGKKLFERGGGGRNMGLGTNVNCKYV